MLHTIPAAACCVGTEAESHCIPARWLLIQHCTPAQHAFICLAGDHQISIATTGRGFVVEGQRAGELDVLQQLGGRPGYELKHGPHSEAWGEGPT